MASFWAIWYGAVRTLLESFREGYNWTVGNSPRRSSSASRSSSGVVTIAWRHRGPRPADPAHHAETEPPARDESGQPTSAEPASTA